MGAARLIAETSFSASGQVGVTMVFRWFWPAFVKLAFGCCGGVVLDEKVGFSMVSGMPFFLR